MRDVAQQGLSRREGIVEMLALREKAGLSTDINAVAAREALTDTRSQIDLLDGEISARRHEIAALLGKSPDFGDAIVRPHLPVIADPAPLSNVPAVLLGYRPDVEAKRAAVEATSNAVGAARAAFYPDVDLVAFAGFRSLDIGHMMRPGSVATQFGPAVTLPIFEGGQLRAALKNRLGEYDAAVNDYNATVSKALQQAADGISDLKARQAARQEAEAAVRHWQHVVDLERIRQKNGLSDTNDRLAAETALLLSERRSVEAAARVAEAQITLIRALGGAWSPSFTSSAGQKYHG
ncbi:RND efflux system outer membrane lipoprotein NodT [Novacetimonas hansenii ATCC 23769]|nr:RND efflux system outer membrane lipoprotein NodT [Novacetimonas hansenii ATCC 23769]